MREAQLDYAMEKIETILAEDPVKVLMPSLNLVRLDIPWRGRSI